MVDSTKVPEKGLFETLLTRNNRQLRDDRAQIIIEDAQLIFKRTIEDIQQNIKKVSRDRENMLDMNPDNKDVILNPSSFDSQKFVDNDLKLGLDLRNLRIKLEIAQERYDELFGIRPTQNLN